MPVPLHILIVVGEKAPTIGIPCILEIREKSFFAFFWLRLFFLEFFPFIFLIFRLTLPIAKRYSDKAVPARANLRFAPNIKLAIIWQIIELQLFNI